MYQEYPDQKNQKSKTRKHISYLSNHQKKIFFFLKEINHKGGKKTDLQGKKSLVEGSSLSLLLVGSKDLAIEETLEELTTLDLPITCWL